MNKMNIALRGAVTMDGSQCIEIYIENNNEVHSLFKGKVQLSSFTEWLREHKSEIMNANLPLNDLTDESLAKESTSFLRKR